MAENFSLTKFDPWIDKEYFKDKTIILAGGCGFLGSWLSSTLCNLESKVYAIDNLSTGTNHHLENLQNFSNFHFINKNIQEISDSDLPEKPDLVFHFASRASPEDYRLYPIDTLESNSVGTKNLLEYTRKNKSKFIFASTSEIYGNPDTVPTPESYYGYVNTMGERSCYDEGKRYSESLIYAYHQTYNLDTRVVRIFNTYGPGLRPDGVYGRALSRFVLQCLRKEPITIYGDGSQTRSFNYVTDTISGILGMVTNKSFNSIPVNVGNNHEITILQLAKIIKKILQSDSPIIFQSPAKDDPKRRCADTTRLKTIGWKPQISLENGLAETISWIKRNYVK